MRHILSDSTKTCVFCVARYSDMVFVADSCLRLIRLLILVQLYWPRVDKDRIEGVISDWRNASRSNSRYPLSDVKVYANS